MSRSSRVVAKQTVEKEPKVSAEREKVARGRVEQNSILQKHTTASQTPAFRAQSLLLAAPAFLMMATPPPRQTLPVFLTF